MATLMKLRKLGEGTYGTVYEANARLPLPSPSGDDEGGGDDEISTDIKVAVKRNFAELSATWISSVRELDLMSRLKGHPFIVDLLDVSFGNPFDRPMTPLKEEVRRMKEDKVHFIMEYVPMSCGTFLADRKRCTPQNIKILLTQLLLGVEFMHSRKVTHRDLKPVNLLVSENPEEGLRLRICDFGMSQILTRSSPPTPGVATSWYRAPEICCAWPTYGPETDVWSIGCIAFEFMSGFPYMFRAEDSDAGVFNSILGRSPHPISRTTIQKMLHSGTRDIKTTHVAVPMRRHSYREQMRLSDEFIAEFNSTLGSLDEFIDLLGSMLKVDPHERISVSAALAHPFFHGMSSYIASCREQYPPETPDLPTIRIIDCFERRSAIKIAFTLYNTRHKFVWYRHRVIFHAIDLFDRYLEHCFDPENLIELRPTETSFAGRVHSKKEVELRFYVCLYLMHKYYSTITLPIEWSTFVPVEFTSDDYLAVAEQFESHLLRYVLKNSIYRDTVLEIPEYYGHPVDESLIYHLLYGYGFCKSWSERSARALYREIRQLDSTGQPLQPTPVPV